MAAFIAMRRTGAAVGDRDEVLASNDCGFGVDAIETDVEYVRQHTTHVAVELRSKGLQRADGAIAERPVAIDARATFLHGGARGGTKASNEMDRDRAWAQAALLAAANHQRGQRRPPKGAASRDEYADALRSMHLVGRPADEINARVTDLIKLLTQTLRCIDV